MLVQPSAAISAHDTATILAHASAATFAQSQGLPSSLGPSSLFPLLPPALRDVFLHLTDLLKIAPSLSLPLSRSLSLAPSLLLPLSPHRSPQDPGDLPPSARLQSACSDFAQTWLAARCARERECVSEKEVREAREGNGREGKRRREVKEKEGKREKKEKKGVTGTSGTSSQRACYQGLWGILCHCSPPAGRGRSATSLGARCTFRTPARARHVIPLMRCLRRVYVCFVCALCVLCMCVCALCVFVCVFLCMCVCALCVCVCVLCVLCFVCVSLAHSIILQSTNPNLIS